MAFKTSKLSIKTKGMTAKFLMQKNNRNEIVKRLLSETSYNSLAAVLLWFIACWAKE